MAEFSWDDMVADADTAAEPVPPGPYNVIVDEAEFRTSSKGDPQVKLRFSIQGGPHNGKAVWNYLTATASSDFGRQMFVQGVRALLGPDAKLDFSQSPEQIAGPFVGKQVSIEVEHDGEYNGAPNIRVKNMKSNAPVAPSAPAAPAEASADTPPPAPLG